MNPDGRFLQSGEIFQPPPLFPDSGFEVRKIPIPDGQGGDGPGPGGEFHGIPRFLAGLEQEGHVRTETKTGFVEGVPEQRLQVSAGIFFADEDAPDAAVLEKIPQQSSRRRVERRPEGLGNRTTGLFRRQASFRWRKFWINIGPGPTNRLE